MYKSHLKHLNKTKILHTVGIIHRRFTSSNQDIKKSVFISQSNDVYTNLALEDWFYKNSDFNNHHVLMLWQNDPCVVIGRFQNPWEEVNASELEKQNITLARRYSGGGTVYHDKGNLNLTFFTSKKHYDRKYNLELITRSIFKEFGVQLRVSPKYDITYQQYKVSGTAAKVGRNIAYHHCTLLVNVNKTNLKQILQPQQVNIKSNATKSVPSPVINLSEVNSNINVDDLMSVIGWEYLRTNPDPLQDEGADYLSRQKGFQLINPTEEWFTGLNKSYNELKSWDWQYGKAPKFSVVRTFTIPTEILPHSLPYNSQQLQVKMFVTNGQIEEVFLHIPRGLLPNGPDGDIKIISNLEGQKYMKNAFKELEFSLQGVNVLDDDKKEFVTNCFRKASI